MHSTDGTVQGGDQDVQVLGVRQVGGEGEGTETVLCVNTERLRRG